MLNWITEKEFVVTEDHIKLLKRSIISWDGRKHGGAAVDYFQPYGSTCLECNISKILDIKPKLDLGKNQTFFSDEQKEYMKKVHRETQIALSIFLKTGTMEPGRYEHDGWYNWRKIQDFEECAHHPV